MYYICIILIIYGENYEKTSNIRRFLDYSPYFINTVLMKHIAILTLILSLSACTIKRAEKTEPFVVDFNSPKIPVGAFEAQFDKTLALLGLKQITITVNYYPAEDAVCLQYRNDLMTYYLFWSKEGREIYASALEQYKEDYAQKNLKAKGSMSTRKQYGRADCYLIWQAAAYLTRSRAGNVTELGYEIKNIDNNNKASFFTLWQRESVYINENETDKNEIRTSMDILIYLTRAKADELAEFFNQDLLDSLVPERVRRMNEPISSDLF